MEHNFNKNIDWFVNQVESRKRLLPVFARASGMLYQEMDKEFDEFIEEYAYDKVFDDEGELLEFGVPQDSYGKYGKIKKIRQQSAIFTDLLPKMTLVSLVSLFDAYLARLLRDLFTLKPEILNASEKNIKLANIMEFESFDEVKEHVISMEVEGILRESHTDQFKWLENRLKIPLRELDIWKEFIEITERRNLFVHADGVVSKQYINICSDVGYSFDSKVDFGDDLTVPFKYYQSACDCVAEIGVKLAQVMWRKILPMEFGKADESLIEVTYNSLVSRDYELSYKLCKLCDIPAIENSCLEHTYYIKLNEAIALKGMEREAELKTLLTTVDWSVMSEKFQLANYALIEDWGNAKKAMMKIGGEGDISKNFYREWPLFKWFRKTDEFKEAYMQVFDEEYKIIGKANLDDDERPEKA